MTPVAGKVWRNAVDIDLPDALAGGALALGDRLGTGAQGVVVRARDGEIGGEMAVNPLISFSLPVMRSLLSWNSATILGMKSLDPFSAAIAPY